MNTQPEALRLADFMIDCIEGPLFHVPHYEVREAAAELRRLHEVNQMLVWAAEMALIGLESMRILLQKGRTAHAENEIAIVFEILSHALAKAKEQS